MREKSVRKGIWYIVGHRRLQKGIFFPLAVFLAGPILGSIASPILIKNNRRTTTTKMICLETTLY